MRLKHWLITVILSVLCLPASSTKADNDSGNLDDYDFSDLDDILVIFATEHAESERVVYDAIDGK